MGALFLIKDNGTSLENASRCGPLQLQIINLRRHGRSISAATLRRTALLMTTVMAVAFFTLNVARATPPVESMLEQRQRQVVLQRWDLSCGAAALATILEYQHGDAVSEREIAIKMMGRAEYLDDPSMVTLRQGFSLLDLKKFVDERGYNGVGLGQMRLEDLLEYSPIIIPISIHGYQHFVVVRGMLNNRILIADPAFGNRTMTKTRFERSWLALPELGRIGFYVERTDGLIPPNRLQATSRDFSILR